jgi:predicted enzyme related to lactoylglutathione lyase
MSDAAPPRNPVGWFEIYVDDLDRATAFYEAVFDVKLEPLPMPDTPGPSLAMHAFPMSEHGGGAGGALVKMDGFGPSPGGTLIYFTCEDCAVEAARVEPAGGRLERAKMSISQYGFVAMALDTEGNLIGLHSRT